MRWSKDDKVAALTNSDAESRALRSKDDKNAANAREYMNSENASNAREYMNSENAAVNNTITTTSEEPKSTIEVMVGSS